MAKEIFEMDYGYINNTEKSTNYPLIDLMKFFCAFLVIGIHTNPFASIPLLDNAFGVVTRIAVPFFFVASSFFFFRSNISSKKCLSFCKRILVMYGVWSVIYFTVDIIISKSFSINNVLTFLLEFFVVGYKHFWFLQALIVAVLLVTVLDYIFRNKIYVYIISISLLICGLALSTYYVFF